MRFWQYIVGTGLALLAFATVLVSENAQFNLQTGLENPFSQTEELTSRVTLSSKDKTLDVFTPDGEFIRIFPGSDVDFSDGKREVIAGEVFLSGSFLNRESVMPTKKETVFLFENFTASSGQVRVGPVMVQYPKARIFVSRNAEEQRSQIYAVGHSVEVWFAGAMQPFVLPSGMKINLREQLIGPRTASLFYSKQKKEFDLRAFELSLDVAEETDSPEHKISLALQAQSQWGKKMGGYALRLPETWIQARSETMFGKLIRGLQKIQARYSIGFPKRKETILAFKELVEPLVQANQLVSEQKKALAAEALARFDVSLKNPRWKQALNGNADLQKEWNTFARAQKAWLQAITPDAPAYVFTEFWSKSEQTDAVGELEKAFSNIEALVANRFFQKARENLTAMAKTLSRT